MNGLKFWEGFERGEQRIFFGVVSATLLAFIVMCIYWAIGLHSMIEWTSSLFSETVPTVLETVSNYPFSLTVDTDSMIFQEFLEGSDINFDPDIHHLYLLLISLGLVVMLTVSTYLKGLWYYVGSAVFITLVIVMKLDLLLLFGQTWQSGTITLLVLTVPLSYYFKSFNYQAPMAVRILSFFGAFLLFGLLVFFFSELSHPFLHIVAYGFPIPLIMTIFAVLMVGHDVVAGFMKAVGSHQLGATSNWKHFYIISLIYIGNLFLIYLHDIGSIDWQIFPVSTILFFVIAWILGIWGFSERESQYRYLIPFQSQGSLFYISLGLIAFATIAFVSATGNDPGLELIEDFVLYSQMAYGFIFLIYITANFISLMSQGMSVHKVLYKPTAMPYFTYRLAGLITMGALIFVQDWKIPIYQGVSTYFINLGDYYNYNQEETAAIGYYREASLYGFRNDDHRSNYVLARMSLAKEDYTSAEEYFVKAMSSRPSEFVFTDLANLYLNQNRYFPALFTLKRGLESFPTSGPIQNNIGLLYGRTGTLDSSLYYLEQAMGDSRTVKAAQNNIYAVLAKSESDLGEDAYQFSIEGNTVNSINRLAYFNTRGMAENGEFMVPDTATMTRIEHAYVYNHLLNALWESDTTDFSQTSELYNKNWFFDRRMILAKALNRYYKGDVTGGIQLMKSINGGDLYWSGKINDLLGKWYFSLGDADKALEYFNESVEKYYDGAAVGMAMSLTRAKKPDESRVIWDSLRTSLLPQVKETALRVLEVIDKTPEEARELPDPEKYQWLLFHPRKAWVEGLVESFENKNYHARTLLDQAQEAYSMEYFEEVAQLLGAIRELEMTEPLVINDFNVLELQMAVLADNLAAVEQYRDQVNIDEGLQKYFTAYLALEQGDSTQAESIYRTWAPLNPFNEELIIAGYKYLEYIGDLENAYSILQEATLANPNSIRLKKQYVRYCGRTGNTNFGYFALMDLIEMLPEEDFNRLKQEYEQGLKEWESFNDY